MAIPSPSKEYEVILLWKYGLLKDWALGKEHNYAIITMGKTLTAIIFWHF